MDQRNKPTITPPTQEQIQDILESHPLIQLDEQVRSAYLIGSFAAGTAHEHSDVDILLLIEPKDDESADVVTAMYRRGLQAYFMQNNITGSADHLHPKWQGRRVDLYFTYDAPKDGLPFTELVSSAPAERAKPT